MEKDCQLQFFHSVDSSIVLCENMTMSDQTKRYGLPQTPWEGKSCRGSR